MTAEATEVLTGPALNPRLLRRLLGFARPHARGFVLSTVLLICLSGLTLAVPALIGRGVNTYLDVGDDASLSVQERRTGLYTLAAILLGLAVLTFLCQFAQILTTNRTGQKVIHDLRMAVYGHITRRNLRFFDTHAVGTLVTRVTSDIETLNEFFLSGVDVLFSDLIRITAITVLLFVINWKMALATLAVVPLILIWAFIFQRRARRLFRLVRGKVGELNAYMNEALSGVRVVQAFSREGPVARRFEDRNLELRDAHLATVRNFSWFFPGMEFLSALGMSMVLVAGYLLVEGGSILAGDVLMFWLYLGLFIEPLRQLADKYNILQAAVASGERVFSVLDDTSALPVREDPIPLAAGRGEVRFENVTFAYDERKTVLHDVSFVVPTGTHLAVVGQTGSGKSTLINLLCRFYDPVSGRILVDGTDLRDLDPHELRRGIGVVLQDVFLFDGTVRENLTLGSPIPDEVLLDAIETVQASAVVQRLGGLEGRVRERGATFSTGEKQLLAFARTLAHDPALLVLDEATAHIDTETEVLLQRALLRLLAGRSAIVIAHRLSTIQHSDRILVLHKGVIGEDGTHEELLAKRGLYSRLYHLQFQRD